MNRHLLTEREMEILTLLCEAAPDKVIARRLGIAIKTVSTHLDHIYSKLDIERQTCNARCAAVAKAVGGGMVQVSGRG